jgi:membrane peptidoglycan carboxypeptidase
MSKSWENVRLDDFTWEPLPPRDKRLRTKLRLIVYFVALSALAGVLVAALLLQFAFPAALASREGARYVGTLPDKIEEPPLPQLSVLRDANGKRFATVTSYDRIPVDSDNIAKVMLDATVATEDARFYTHHGYDPVGILRAIKSNSAGQSELQGASTITQQYVKNVLVLASELGSTDDAAETGAAVSVTRKIREIKLATGLERQFDKTEILTKYLNIAFFGNNSYGIEAAARRYFSVHARDLSLTQAATLVPLLKNPAGFNPIKYPEVALERRSIVLQRMVDAGYLTQAEADEAKTTKLGLKPSRPKTGCHASKYPFYCAEVLDQLRNDKTFGKTAEERAKLLTVGGLTIRTALDPQALTKATEAAESTIPATHPVATASTIIRPGTGEVVSIATNRGYGNGKAGLTEIVLPTASEFQPGSTFKLFTLAAALDQGFPLSTRVPGGARYTSKTLNNPDIGYYSNSAGSTTNPDLTTATKMSMNTAYVQLEERVGVRAVAEMANRLGVKSLRYQGKKAPNDVDGSYTLGVANVSTTEMATAYATIAAGGIYCPPKFITAMEDADGTKLAIPGGECTRVLDEAAANSIAHVLGQVISSGTGKPASIGRPAAGKTGTTENLGAAWFAGFTPQYATAVWVGDPRGGASHPLRNVLGYASVYGGTLPATVWRKTMTAVHEGLEVKELPKADPSYVATTSGQLLPSVIGIDEAAARNRISVAGARVTKILTVAPKRGQHEGVVVKQSPAAGSRSPGTKVTLAVTKKP